MARRDDDFAKYVNDGDGVVVSVTPRYASSSHAKRGKADPPNSFRVTLQQDWFGRGAVGDQQTAAKTQTFEEALDVATDFMRQYSENRAGFGTRREQALEQAEGVDERAAVATEVTAETVTDVVGYSEEFLVQTLARAFGVRLQAVVHRDGEDVDVVYAREDVAETVDDRSVHRLFARPSIDKHGVETAFDRGAFSTLTLSFDEVRIFRFVGDGDVETAVCVDADAPVELPLFERTLRELLGTKWQEGPVDR